MMGPFSETMERESLNMELNSEMIRPPVALERPISPRAAFPIAVEDRVRILVVDGDHETSSIVAEGLPLDEGYDVTYWLKPASDLETLLVDAASSGKAPFDLVLWGLRPPFEADLECLNRLRMVSSTLRVVILAPSEALSHAASIKAAAAEAFILKPLHVADLRMGVDRALSPVRKAAMPASLSVLSSDPRGPRVQQEVTPAEDGRDLGLIGTSPEMRRVVSLIRRLGPASVNVLVTGESGTGKEMVAQAIHRVSDRAKKPFIAINCAAIPRELLESELFGHAKGAFTGATSARRGLFEEANEGTILLDEIGDLPLSLQAKILRLLQTRQVKPLGQNVMREVDVRIISATHKNLKALIQKGEFREDLYYRLNVMPVHLAPLRERKEDIMPLVDYFLRRYAERKGTTAPTITKKAAAKMLDLPWKGNVRELENVVERAIVLSDGRHITDQEVMTEEMEPVRLTSEDLFNAGMTLKDIEREYIKYVLSRTGNRKEAATRILGIDRKTLYRKEKLYGFRPPDDLQ
jgi:DNA-binding NtrC family response regulator